MLIFYSPWEYLLGLAVWLICLSVLLRVFLLKRRNAKRRADPRRLGYWNAALSCWMFLAFLTGCELCFALFVDHTDAMNATNISKRWIVRHIDKAQNNIGFRDVHDFPKRLPRGVKRICFFGDSFTAGHGVADMSARFTDLIGERLEEVHPGKYVVANMGQLGYEAALVEALVRAALLKDNQIDMAVYVYMMNDIEGFDPRTQEAIKHIQKKQPPFWLFKDTYFFNWLYFRMVEATGPRAGGYFSHLVDSYNSESWEHLANKLRQLHEDCRSRGVDFRMVLFPFLHDLGPGYPFKSAHAKLVRFCEAEGIPVLDLEPVLEPHAREGLEVNPYDAHPNERAHKLAAEAIEKHLLGDVFAAEHRP